MRLRFLTLFALGTLLTLLPAVNAAPSSQITTLPDGSVKLTADDGEVGDVFGGAVAVDGDTALVGAPQHANSRGSAYVFVRDESGTWTQQAKLIISDGAFTYRDLFGWSVALEGDTALVGARSDDSRRGSVYVFVRDENGIWTQQAKLTASDGMVGDSFGEDIALVGDTMLVGAYHDDEERGSAYVFVRDESGTWTQQAKLTASDRALGDQFGQDVALAGDTALIGADSDDDRRGSAYVFVRDENGIWTQQAKLTASDANVGDFFGISVALSGDTALVGAYFDDDNGISSGGAYTFVRDESGTWTQQAKLIAPDGMGDNIFGSEVALTGDTALVGAPHFTNRFPGSVYVFSRNSDSTWTIQRKITTYEREEANKSGFGAGIALSGNNVLIGSPSENLRIGSAYIYEDALMPDTIPPVITLDGDNPLTIEAGTSYFDPGFTVTDDSGFDLYNDVMIGDDNFDPNTTGTYIITYNVSDLSNNRAIQVTRTVNVVDTTPPVITLNGEDPLPVVLGSTFTDPGVTVSDNSDEDLRDAVIVTGEVDTNILGETYTLTYNVSDSSGNAANQISRMVEIVLDTVPPVITLAGDNPFPVLVGTRYTEPGFTITDNSGDDLSDVLIIGGDMVDIDTIGNYTVTYDVTDNSGNVALQATRIVKVVESPITILPDGSVKLIALDGEAEDRFGFLAFDGDTAVIGAPTDSDNGEYSGSAYVFVRDEFGNWTQQAKLFPDDGEAWRSFGFSVDLSEDTAIIGTLEPSSSFQGSAYVFVRDNEGNWYQQAKLIADDGGDDDNFGFAVAIDGSTAVIGDIYGGSTTLAGQAYVFTRDNRGNWHQQAQLMADDAAHGDYFGTSVALDGNTIIIGADGDDDQGEDSGSVYVFTHDSNGNWSQQSKIVASDGMANDLFGSHTGIVLEGDTALVAAYGDDSNTGSVYVFNRDAQGNWSEQGKLTAPDGIEDDFFGDTVSLDGNTALFSASGDENGIGSVYVFTRDEENSWHFLRKLTAYDGETMDYFGYVALDDGTAVIGAWGDDSNQGSAYVFENVTTTSVLDVVPDGVITPADVVYVINRLGEPDGIADVDGVDGVTQADVDAVMAALGTDLRNLDD